MSGKDGILAEIRKIEAKMAEIIPKLNTYDCILILMAYMEILDNEQHSLQRRIIKEKSGVNDFQLLIRRNIILKTGIIRKCIQYLHSISNNRKTLSKIPPLESLVIQGDAKDPEVMIWIHKNHDRRKDEVLFIPIKLLNRFDATRIIIWKGFHQTTGKEQIILAMEFLRYFHTRESLQALLNHNISVNISSDGSKIEDGLSPEEILERENYHPRLFHSMITDRFPQWKSDVMKVNEETLLSTHLDAISPGQRQMYAKEHRIFYNEFAAIPGFSDRFLAETKISLDGYCEITLALERIALDQDPPVIFFPKSKVIRKAKQKTGCSESDILRVLDMFTCKPDEEIEEKRFLFDGQNYIFTWSMIVIPFQRYVEKVYRDFIDGNFQGVAFEKECRSVLESNSWSVLETRLEINKQIIPDEVSMRLWGRIKKKTDIDVVATKCNYLLIVECKSEVHRLQRRETQLNIFGKYYEELLNKSQWIANNFTEFRQLLNSHNFSLPEGISQVIPMLTGAFIEPYRHSMIISLKELGEILRKIPTDSLESEIEILLDSKVELKLPVFRILPSSS